MPQKVSSFSLGLYSLLRPKSKIFTFWFSSRSTLLSVRSRSTVAPLVAVLKDQEQPLEAALGPCLHHAALLIQVGVHASPTEVFHNEESLSSVSVTFRSFTVLGGSEFSYC